MKPHKKPEDMNRERQDIPFVIKWLSDLGIYGFKEAIYYEQINGVDLIQESTGKTYEVKIRYKPRYLKKDILIEVKSKIEEDTPGWIVYSKANLLVYVFLKNNKILGGHIFDLPLLRMWWFAVGQFRNYPIKESPNTGYTTLNYAVPLGDIPQSMYKYSTVLRGKNHL